jgi:hypothetical protein
LMAMIIVRIEINTLFFLSPGILDIAQGQFAAF